MSKYPQSIDACIVALCDHIRRETTLTPRSEAWYRDQCRLVFKILDDRRAGILPHEVTRDDVVWLREEMSRRGYTVSTCKGYFSALKRITVFFDNSAVAKTSIRWPSDCRPNVDWLSYDDAKTLLSVPKTPMQDIIIHLELCMGLRRVEVARLRIADITDTYLNVTGKGPRGGKPRRVPYHPSTGLVINRYMAHREELISKARRRRPSVQIPDRLLIWQRSGYLYDYITNESLSGIDRQVEKLSASTGIKFSNHTLRRTFGRTMYRSGVPVATISKILGHEDTVMTLRYIGVDMDDMASAMQQFNLR